MQTEKSIIYLFDPLCGWCYGASPKIKEIVLSSADNLSLLPTGLFINTGISMDAQRAEYFWKNDQRIAQISGQIFSTQYQQQVLNNLGSDFDSYYPTLVIIISQVLGWKVSKQFAVLNSLQKARYVKGDNIICKNSIKRLLIENDFTQLAEALDNAGLYKTALQDTTTKAQQLLQQHHLTGVPQLIVAGKVKPIF